MMLIKAQTTLCLSALGIVPLKRNEKKIKFKALTSKLTNWYLFTSGTKSAAPIYNKLPAARAAVEGGHRC
jgi:hypothetical protein